MTCRPGQGLLSLALLEVGVKESIVVTVEDFEVGVASPKRLFLVVDWFSGVFDFGRALGVLEVFSALVVDF